MQPSSYTCTCGGHIVHSTYSVFEAVLGFLCHLALHFDIHDFADMLGAYNGIVLG